MPKKNTNASSSPSAEGKSPQKRGPPAPEPPLAIIKRIAKRAAEGKVFRGPCYKILVKLAVVYLQGIGTQVIAIHENDGSKTFTWKNLELIAKVSHTAGTTPTVENLTQFADAAIATESSKETTIKKKAKRAAKKAKLQAEKAAAAAASAATEAAAQ